VVIVLGVVNVVYAVCAAGLFLGYPAELTGIVIALADRPFEGVIEPRGVLAFGSASLPHGIIFTKAADFETPFWVFLELVTSFTSCFSFFFVPGGGDFRGYFGAGTRARVGLLLTLERRRQFRAVFVGSDVTGLPLSLG
jgi:hypothetical protein